MMGHKKRQFDYHERICLDDLVPSDHFYRKLETAVDLSFVRKLAVSVSCPASGGK